MPERTTVGADDTFEQVLSQPAPFLRELGITSGEIQRKLRKRARIFVVGAGFVRDEGLAAFTEIPNPPSKTGIHVAGAGSVRDIGLVALAQ